MSLYLDSLLNGLNPKKSTLSLANILGMETS